MRPVERHSTTVLLAVLAQMGASAVALADNDAPASPLLPPSDISPATPASASTPTVPAVAPSRAPAVAAPAASSEAASPLKIETPNSSIKFGFLAQPQFEAAGAPVGTDTSLNLYLRRVRLLVGGTLFNSVEYFFETDSPNLFKAGADGTKTTSAMFVQDAFATVKLWKDMVKVDAGYMLPALAHNALQSAASLYGLDYFANTFLHSNLLGSAINPIGRDLGVQLRGLLLSGLLEYRVGAFQGRREAPATTPSATPGGSPTVDQVAARNNFRFTGRLQLNLLDPETGFFYAGTYLGTKRVFSLGAAYDYQHGDSSSYKYWAADGLLDLPLGPGAATAQVNFAHWQGGELATLSKRYAVMGEAGYRIAYIRLSPILRFERLWIPGSAGGPGIHEDRFGGGLAFWSHGHNSNLKAFYTRVQSSSVGQGHYNVFNLQWQVFVF